MTDFSCINCGSNQIKILRNENMITSQAVYQELLKLKEQKEKQLEEKIHTKPIQILQNKYKKTIKNIVEDRQFLMGYLIFLCFLIFFIFMLSIEIIERGIIPAFEELLKVSIEYLKTNPLEIIWVLLLFFVYIYVLGISMRFLIFIISLIKFPFDLLSHKIQIIKLKKRIEEINQKIQTWSNLYYCHECNQVMDLETKLYDSPEKIKDLVYQIYQKQKGKD